MWRDVYNSQHEMRIHVKQHISPHSPQYRPQDILRPALKFWISLSVFVRYFMPLKLFRVSLSQTWRHHLAKNIQLYSSFSNYCPGHRHPRGPSLHSTPSRQKNQLKNRQRWRALPLVTMTAAILRKFLIDRRADRWRTRCDRRVKHKI